MWYNIGVKGQGNRVRGNLETLRKPQKNLKKFGKTP